MPYTCELAPGHHVYLDNQGEQTVITTAMGLQGQQQQASNSIMTGVWTAPPEAYRTDSGAMFKVFTAQGETCIHVQGNSVSTVAAVAGAKPITMQQTAVAAPMQPMQPMTLGNMQMSMNPMEMRMGNMELKMDMGTPSSAAQSPVRQFCSQCGAKVAPEDKFCSSCGHSLS